MVDVLDVVIGAALDKAGVEGEDVRLAILAGLLQVAADLVVFDVRRAPRPEMVGMMPEYAAKYLAAAIQAKLKLAVVPCIKIN